MLVTTTTTKKTYQISLRPWDGCQWLPDCAGDVLDTWAGKVLHQVPQAEIDWLVQECERFNAGQDLDWLVHCPNCQEVWLEVQEVDYE